MRRLQTFFSLLLFSSIALYYSQVEGAAKVTKTITVGHSGDVDFNSINQAIAAVPAYNKEWIKIKVNAGVYREKVNIDRDKGFIVLEGSGADITSIEWGDHVDAYMPKINTVETATFTCSADDIVLRGISFKNTFETGSQPKIAVAALIIGDRTSVYGCSFFGFQDTLSDMLGRHYYKGCLIVGNADFIFGYAQSIYENCHIRTNGSLEGAGFITAQGRSSDADTSGFVFKSCTVSGTVKAHLGRAWKSHSRVVFYQSTFSDVVVPQGWDNWGKPVQYITYAEANCKGPGAQMGGRVNWEKKLSPAVLRQLVDISFIDNEGWLAQQPS